MAIGDVRKCSFCLKTYVLKQKNGSTERCRSCETRHYKSKHKKIKSGIAICGGTAVSNEERSRRSQAGNKKNIELVGVQLNWGASKE